MPSQVVKRRRTDHEAGSLQQDELTGHLKSSKTPRELAEPYRICTAKFPIDALTPSWSIGSNRPIDSRHVLRLCKTFRGDGIQRESQNNYLLVGCTGDQIERMRSRHHLVDNTTSWSNSVPSFSEWMTINGQKAEIISGQHRVEALRMFLEQNGKQSEHHEHWWVCDVYNLGTLCYW